MKKSLLSLASLALALLFGAAIAQEAASGITMYEAFPNDETVSDSYIKLLNNYSTSWWYTTKDNTVTLETPIIFDSDLYEAPSYRFYFTNKYRVEQLKWDDGVDLASISMNEAKWDGSSDVAKFEITSDKYTLNPAEAYYGFIIPINDYEVVGTPSTEICFQLEKGLFDWGNDCDAFETLINPLPVDPEPVVEDNPTDTEEEHDAAGNCIGMDLANLSHTINNNIITVRWTAVDGDVVQVAVWDPQEEVYRNIGAVKMSDEQFNYQMTWDWEYNFKITNGCKDVFYKADASIKTPEEKIVPPATGPAENVLYIAIAAIVLYGVYTLATRKSEN